MAAARPACLAAADDSMTAAGQIVQLTRAEMLAQAKLTTWH